MEITGKIVVFFDGIILGLRWDHFFDDQSCKKISIQKQKVRIKAVKRSFFISAIWLELVLFFRNMEVNPHNIIALLNQHFGPI
jgi:hypothetical protein